MLQVIGDAVAVQHNMKYRVEQSGEERLQVQGGIEATSNRLPADMVLERARSVTDHKRTIAQNNREFGISLVSPRQTR